MGKIVLNHSTPIDDRQFGNKTMPEVQVVAKPVDTFVPSYPDQSANQLLKALTEFQSAQDLAARTKVIGAIQDKQAGMAAAARDEEVPETASSAFAKGFWALKGQAALRGFGQELGELQASNPGMTLDQWTKESNELQMKYIRGQNDSFLSGFVPGALGLQHQYDQIVMAKQKTILKQDVVTNVQKVINDKFDGIFNGHISTMDAGVQSLLSQNATPEQIDSYAITQNNSTATKLSSALQEIQELGKTVGLSRTDTSKLFAETIGRRARELGKPELNLWATIPIDGVKPVDIPEVAKIVDTYTREAQASRDHLMSMARTAKTQKEVEDSRAAQSYIVGKLISLNDDTGASPEVIVKHTNDLLNELKSFVEGTNSLGIKIRPEAADALRKGILDMRTGKSLGIQTDPETHANLMINAFNGKLDWSDVFLGDNAKKISNEDKLSLIQLNLQRQSTLSNRDEAQDMALFNKAVEDAKGVVGVNGNIVSDLPDPAAAKRKQAMSYEMTTQYFAFKRDNPKGRITPEILNKWAKDAETKVMSMYPSPFPAQKPSGTSPSSPSPTAKPATEEEAKQKTLDRLDRMKIYLGGK